MREAFVKIDLHGLTQDEAIKVIDKAIANAGPTTYHLQLIHGYNRGTSLRTMIHDWYQYARYSRRVRACLHAGAFDGQRSLSSFAAK